MLCISFESMIFDFFEYLKIAYKLHLGLGAFLI